MRTGVRGTSGPALWPRFGTRVIGESGVRNAIDRSHSTFLVVVVVLVCGPRPRSLFNVGEPGRPLPHDLPGRMWSARRGGLIGKIQNGDMIRIDWDSNRIELLVDQQTLAQRGEYTLPPAPPTLGRQLFGRARTQVSPADQGASFIL